MWVALLFALLPRVVALPLRVHGYVFPSANDFLLGSTSRYRPRMLAMSGCSGSSAVMAFSRHLLQLHGIPVPDAGGPHFENGKLTPPKGNAWPAELLNPRNNWYYESEGKDMGKAMIKMEQELQVAHKTLFFKGMFQNMQNDGRVWDEWAELEPVFKSWNMYAVVGQRHNVLDQVICQIKDCFQDGYGYPVDSKGNQSDVCFGRRDLSPVDAPAEKALIRKRDQIDEDSKKYLFQGRGDDFKAHVNTVKLIEHIETEKEALKNTRHLIRHRLGINVTVVNEEDLLDFQSETAPGGSMHTAVMAWADLLIALGAEPDLVKIRDFLAPYQGTYRHQQSHRDVISNFKEVEEILHNTNFKKYFRKH